ncbi:hypothetical protein [Polynucleobacter sp. JS-Fieb-80-E5]|uniref:hypothetical protein n=1 Tax=Polynucleobacter sp. JS-Fieb-80-E5 TaxID=2081050 RepID=UPI001C0B5F39|nr:hypothetical protein [Polynucleobacter sp. JS-Fieb-80-E5]MBU3618775.1 hypothetical protein [Polynucleobacter sp. JS-Fieb-80-E5]
MNKDLENQIIQLEKEVAALSGAAYTNIFFTACGGFYRPLPTVFDVVEWLKDCGINAIDPLISFDFRPEITFPRLRIPNDNPPNSDWYQVRMPGTIHSQGKETLDWCHPILNKRYEDWKQRLLTNK